ncbi:transmembrane protein 222 [Condylostylus longicornis]|uniref:transmembrane protein 222 n=1 Tax=Condylostylus longicornis TaxID=2530218 RepID=UPI00244DC24A|nr:transmembrane protein 222 [Condylostylus longicornis]
MNSEVIYRMIPTSSPVINFDTDKYPFCIVWTPIPVLTWFFPFIGHMGIAMSNGVIRDFAGSYFVSEDNMGFGRPTRFLILNPDNVTGGREEWDESVSKASVIYGTKMHNLLWDNCHSHVGMSLSMMQYNGRSYWGMVILAGWMFFCGKYVGISGFLKTWLPFFIIVSICTVLAFVV